MRKISKKNNRSKMGGECNQEVKQSYDYHLKKIGDILDDGGVEKKITDQLYNSLSGVSNYLQKFLLVKIHELTKLFNDNTDRKRDILKIIKQMEEVISEVDKTNTICYEDLLKSDPRGDEFGKEESDKAMVGIYGDDVESYYNKQIEYIKTLLDNHPKVGLVRPKKDDDEEDENETEVEEDELAIEEKPSGKEPDFKKPKSDVKFQSFEGPVETNYNNIIKNINNYLKNPPYKTKEDETDPGDWDKQQEKIEKYQNVVLPELAKAQTEDDVKEIITKYEVSFGSNKARGGKSKRINKTRKYRSRRQ
jgi:hypothetical protein